MGFPINYYSIPLIPYNQCYYYQNICHMKYLLISQLHFLFPQKHLLFYHLHGLCGCVDAPETNPIKGLRITSRYVAIENISVALTTDILQNVKC